MNNWTVTKRAGIEASARSPDFMLPRWVARWLFSWAVIVCFTVASLAAPPPPLYREGRVLLKPVTGAQAGILANFHSARGARVLRDFKNLGGVQVLELPAGKSTLEAIQEYRQSGLVEYAEPDYLVFPVLEPNDPRYLDGTLWHLHNTGQNGGVAGADIHAPQGWDVRSTASNIVVAVVETGVRYTHEDLAANMWVNPVDGSHGTNAANGSTDVSDLDGHGTEVAGVLAAVGNNNLGVVGVAWRLNLMACRYYDDQGTGTVSAVVGCMSYAQQNGAQIINASFVVPAYSVTLYNAVNSCRAAGIIVVAAAGNNAANNDLNPVYPANFQLDNVVSVAATTQTDALAGFSNFGVTNVALAAPGMDIYTTRNSSDSAYGADSGTSFAAPMISGALALLKAQYPTSSYHALLRRLYAGTDPLPSLAGQCVTGGRLNLAKVLTPAPIAEFTATPTNGAAPLTVSFTDNSCCGITNWSWDFGDGNASTQQNPSHAYAQPGTFTATLTVTDATGQTNSTSVVISSRPNYQITNATFAWIDPTGMTPVTLNFLGTSPAEPLPFTFNFYGQSYNQLYVGANGLLGFLFYPFSVGNNDLPNLSGPTDIVCPFWDTFDLSTNGTVYFGTNGVAPNRKVVVSWVSVPRALDHLPRFTFQVWLEEGTGQIQFQYLDVQPGSQSAGAAGKAATVGIEDSTGIVAAKYSYHGSQLLSNNQAILFIPPSAPTLTSQPQSQVVNLGSNATFMVTALGIPSLTYQWWFNTTNILAGATNSTLTITNVQDTNAGNYSVVVSAGYSVTSSNALLTVNHLPIPAAPVLERYAAYGVKIRTASFLGTDPDSDPLSLTSVGPVSAQGGGAGLTGDWVFYTPPSGYGGNDTFPFAVSDGRGGISPGSAVVNVITNTSASLNFGLQRLPDGSAHLAFDGIPARSYAVQFTENLATPNWQTLATLTADQFGIFTFIDTPPNGSPQRYYRAIEP